MKRYELMDLKVLSLNDFEVVGCVLDEDRRYLKIETDGAFLDVNDGLFFDKSDIHLVGWESIILKVFYHKEGVWVEKKLGYDCLREVCEFEVAGNRSVLVRGFGRKTGHWEEVLLVKCDLKVYLYRDEPVEIDELHGVLRASENAPNMW
jgi:hypothetical protein